MTQDRKGGPPQAQLAISDLPKGDLSLIRPLAELWQPQFWSYAELAESWARQKGLAALYAGPIRSDSEVAAVLIYCMSIDYADLLFLYVAPPWRQQGLAKSLLSQYHSKVSQAGIPRAFLEVRQSNAAAIALYQSFGYELTRVRRKYYPDGEDGLDMIKEIS